MDDRIETRTATSTSFISKIINFFMQFSLLTYSLTNVFSVVIFLRNNRQQPLLIFNCLLAFHFFHSYFIFQIRDIFMLCILHISIGNVNSMLFELNSFFPNG